MAPVVDGHDDGYDIEHVIRTHAVSDEAARVLRLNHARAVELENRYWAPDDFEYDPDMGPDPAGV